MFLRLCILVGAHGSNGVKIFRWNLRCCNVVKDKFITLFHPEVFFWRNNKTEWHFGVIFNIFLEGRVLRENILWKILPHRRNKIEFVFSQNTDKWRTGLETWDIFLPHFFNTFPRIFFFFARNVEVLMIYFWDKNFWRVWPIFLK